MSNQHIRRLIKEGKLALDGKEVRQTQQGGICLMIVP